MTKGADNSQFGYLCTVEIKKTSFENNKRNIQWDLMNL